MMQSLLPAIYPTLKDKFHLDFAHIGLITPDLPADGLPAAARWSGFIPTAGRSRIRCRSAWDSRWWGWRCCRWHRATRSSDRGRADGHRPRPCFTRVVASGAHGLRRSAWLAQSLFQVGGNAGSSLGPLLAAFIVVPQRTAKYRLVLAGRATGDRNLSTSAVWYQERGSIATARKAREASHRLRHLPARGRSSSPRRFSIALIFSKYFYLASLRSYYTFYLISKFHVSVQTAQIYLFIFLGAVAAGTIIGGPVGDRIGRKYVIWVRFSACCRSRWCCRYANLFWTGVLSVIIGLILASAFSAILVYAQELSRDASA